jgi:hypothetical protein
MQPWIPNFDPVKPIGMKMPVWITFKNVRDELKSSATELVASLGPILGKHRGNPYNIDQKFCIAITTGTPLDLTIEAINPITQGTTTIQVDYNNFSIHCRFLFIHFSPYQRLLRFFSQSQVCPRGEK